MARITSEIRIGPVLPDDTDAKFIEEGLENVYMDYRIQSRYEKDPHVYMMPVSYPTSPAYGLSTAPASTPLGTTTSVSFVQLAAPTLIWLVDWTCSRANKKPDIPDPRISSEFGWVLLDEQYEPYMIAVGADGISPVWRISGTYVYGHNNPSVVTVDDLTFPRPPWLMDFVERNIPRSMLKYNLINPANRSEGRVAGGVV